jgi:hypothetical protein
MAWTNIPNGNLAAGAPIRSVDHLAMRDNDVYLRDPILGTILSEQTITTSSTWTKPTGSQFENTDFICFLAVGGGGGGGVIRTTSSDPMFGDGGDGGKHKLMVFKYLNCPSSATITIGAGGTGYFRNSNGSTNGDTGGNTEISMTGYDTGSLRGLGGVGGGAIEFVYPTTQPRIVRPYLGNNNSSNGFISRGGVGAINASNVPYTVPPEGVNFAFSDGTGGAGAAGSGVTAGNGTLGAGGGGAATKTSATSGNGGNGVVKVFIVRGSSFNILNYLMASGARTIERS